jgi:hypothetical protein
MGFMEVFNILYEASQNDALKIEFLLFQFLTQNWHAALFRRENKTTVQLSAISRDYRGHGVQFYANLDS